MEFDARVTSLSMSPDGTIVFQRQDPKTLEDIWAAPPSPGGKPFAFQSSGPADTHPQVSPDGKWLAYSANEIGAREVHVRSFPGGSVKQVVSTGGGGFPRWRSDGRELFYVKTLQTGIGTQMAVEFRAAVDGARLGQAIELFDNEYQDAGPDRGGNYHIYAVSRDGQRFLIPRSAAATRAGAVPEPIVVVVNWASTLER
jgi:Tol biopolymer transport system component